MHLLPYRRHTSGIAAAKREKCRACPYSNKTPPLTKRTRLLTSPTNTAPCNLSGSSRTLAAHPEGLETRGPTLWFLGRAGQDEFPSGRSPAWQPGCPRCVKSQRPAGARWGLHELPSAPQSNQRSGRAWGRQQGGQGPHACGAQLAIRAGGAARTHAPSGTVGLPVALARSNSSCLRSLR